ncbi:retrovirus-related Pol polyprotein from transposon TNT 1-94 [Trichonephila clavipes]|nr:retrovirus-related Pol polyprotein from transposon TNT 1-94 [Trichonephila clavipes]
MEPSIERLNSTNYRTWKEDVRVLLMDRNSWRIITGQEVKPDDGASAKEKCNFESRWNQAYSTIYLSIEKEYRNLISDTCDPIVAWKKLQDHFQAHTCARVIGLLDEFFNCRTLEEEEIGFYAARLRTIIFQLGDAGHPLEDLYQSFQLIRSSQNESIRGIPKLKSINVECEDCKIGKTSHDGSNYFLSITDDYSRKVTVFPIKRKSDVFNCFARYQSLISLTSKRLESAFPIIPPKKRILTISTANSVFSKAYQLRKLNNCEVLYGHCNQGIDTEYTIDDIKSELENYNYTIFDIQRFTKKTESGFKLIKTVKVTQIGCSIPERVPIGFEIKLLSTMKNPGNAQTVGNLDTFKNFVEAQ